MRIFWSIVLVAVLEFDAKAIFFDGSGHYGLLGEARTNQAFVASDDRYQAIRQSFSLLAEARYNDRLSLFLELQLFADPLNSLLGDQAEARPCPVADDGASHDCRAERDLSYPVYEKFKPRIAQLYARYAFNYCLLEVGRRGRDWGLGIFLDSGQAPFSTQQSIFDGLTCHVNVQKNQTLGFSVGYDSLAETGSSSIEVGTNNNDDDIHQLFFTIEYDNREATDNSGFSRVTAGYFATIFAEDYEISVKFFDLYVALFYKKFLATRHELLFRLGKSADPSWHKLGGKNGGDEPVVNELNAIAVAGDIAWTFYEKGNEIDVVNNRPKAKHRHTLLAGYVIAPGDRDGYLDNNSESTRDTDVSALALHGNFKPALIFYNAIGDEQAIDGIYNPQQLVNTNLFWIAYRYDNYLWGAIELKLLSGMLRETSDDHQTIGHQGRALGYELDLHYSYQLHNEVDVGLGGAIAFPGKAWQIDDDPQTSVLLQSSVAFKF